jgi:hypothetical protein
LKKMEKKMNIRKTLVTAMVAFGTLVSTQSLFAGPPPMPGQAWNPAHEHVVFVIDRSGSMAKIIKNPITGVNESSFKVAQQDIYELLDQDLNALGDTTVQTRNYELWTFTSSGGVQKIVDFSENFSGGVLLSKADRIQKIRDAVAALPAPGGGTPLAEAQCAAIRELQAWGTAAAPKPGVPALQPWDARRVLYLFTDIEENASAGECAPDLDANGQKIQGGTFSFDANINVATHQISLGGTFPAVGSWEWKVLNMAFSGNPNRTTIAPTAPIFATPVWNITDLFNVTGQSTSFSLENQQSVGNQSPVSVERSLLKGLTKLSGGRYTQTLAPLSDNENRVRLPGDVDNNPCVDYADLDVVLRYYDQRVNDREDGRELRARADFNGDGWVNVDDYLILLQHYGEGC